MSKNTRESFRARRHFNWQVQLMRQTGVDKDGQPSGEPIGYKSLYWYVQWLYPPGEKASFQPRCPNPQF